MNLFAIILSAMTLWFPPQKHATRHEKLDETEERYRSIASDIEAEVLADPKGSPFPAVGVPDPERVRYALLMASIALYESGYAKDVDTCAKGGDGNKAWGLWQVHVPKERACSSRRAGLRIAARFVHLSFSRCSNAETVGDRLALYATGACVQQQRESRTRVNTALKFKL